jgi:Fic family protein
MRIPEPPTGLNDLLSGGAGTGETLLKLMAPAVVEAVRQINEKYLHWDKVKYHPVPEGLDSLHLWQAVKLARRAGQQALPLTFNRSGRFLHLVSPPSHQGWTHRIDIEAGVAPGLAGHPLLDDQGERYRFGSLMEEAIASSQLEGAITTRRVAKEMLRTNRRPRSDSERMILNNYQAILAVRELKDEPLTPEVLRHLQGVLTGGTLAEEAVGRFRREGEAVEVVDSRTGEVLHVPPAASEIDWRVREICDFANQVPEPFVHPVVKASVLHFALGYLHPFVDGNGRTARAIFYWSMLRSGYGLVEYFPISRVLVKAPAQYGRAYLHTETDGGDVTYFVRFHLQVVLEAMRDFQKYLAREADRARQASRLLEARPGLNDRQRAVVLEFLEIPGHSCTFRSHEGKYKVTYPTARTDLLGLEKLGLLRMEKAGRAQVFRAAGNLAESLRPPKSEGKHRQAASQERGAGTLWREAIPEGETCREPSTGEDPPPAQG